MKLETSALLFYIFIAFFISNATAFTISAEVNNDGNVVSVHPDIVETSDFKITFRPINWKFISGDTSKIYRQNSEYLEALYPLSENRFKRDYFFLPHFTSRKEQAPVSGLIYLMNNLYLEELLRFNIPDRVVGIIDSDLLNSLTVRPLDGASFYPINFTTVLISTDKNSTAAHEIGHTLGFCDEYSGFAWGLQNIYYPGGCKNLFPSECSGTPESCGGNTDIQGFWVKKERRMKTLPPKSFYFESCQEAEDNLLKLKQELEYENCVKSCLEEEGSFEITCSSKFYNFMGYLEPSWIDKSSYETLLNRFSVQPLSFSSFEANQSTIYFSSPQSLIISGLVDKNGSVILDDLYIIDGSQESEIPTGPYSLKLLDSGDGVLFEKTFDVSFLLLSDPPIELNTTGFVFTVPFSEGTHKIQIDFNGQTRATRLVSSNTPTTSFTVPSGGEEWSATETVTWNASDLDGDDLSFVLQYSTDNGLTWNPLAIDLNEQNFELDTGYLTPSEEYKLKVIATDGVLTGEATSNTFTVRNADIDVQPWRLELGEVEQGEIASYNANLVNTGNANLKVTSYNAPTNIEVFGLSPPLTLMPDESIQFQIDFNSARLEGVVDQNIVFYSNDPNEGEKHLFIEGTIIILKTFDGNLHLEGMPFYQKEQEHFSGAATAKMIPAFTGQDI